MSKVRRFARLIKTSFATYPYDWKVSSEVVDGLAYNCIAHNRLDIKVVYKMSLSAAKPKAVFHNGALVNLNRKEKKILKPYVENIVGGLNGRHAVEKAIADAMYRDLWPDGVLTV